MTSAESPNYMETSSPDYSGGAEKKKPSLMNKVKAKAKKIKDKLKPGHGEGENFRQDEDMTTTTTNNSSSSVSSFDEEEEAQHLSYTPLSDAVNLDDDKTSAHASRAPKDIDYSDRAPLEDRKFGLLDSPNRDHNGHLAHEDPSAPVSAGGATVGDSIPLSQFRSAGPPGVEQAVPTSYHCYNQSPSPSEAYRTSISGVRTDATGDNTEDRSTQLREESPSVPGGQSDGITPLLSESTAFGSGKSEVGDRSFSSGEFSLQGSSNRSRLADISDVSASGGIESDSSNKFGREEDSLGSGSRSFTQDFGVASGGTESASSKKFGREEDSLGSGRGSDTQDFGEGIPINNVGSTVLENRGDGSVDRQVPEFQSSSTENDSSESQMPFHQRAYDAVVGSKDESQNAQPDEPSVGQEVYGEQKSYTQQGSNDRTMTQKAYDALVGVKDTAADKVGGETSRTDDSSPHSNSFFSSAAAPVSEFNSETESKPEAVTERVGDTAASLKNTIISTFGSGGSPQIDRDETASTATSTDQKPLTKNLAETGIGWKETLASKLGYGGSTTHTPGEEETGKAKARAVDLKNTATDKLGQADVALSADSTPVSQKGLDKVNRAKDYTVSTLSPTEDDKALSNTVTETLSNLPALLNEKLGFGGSSPTTTPKSDSSEFDVPVSKNPSDGDRKDTIDTPRNEAAGVINRMTDAFSSLFGGDKKSSPDSPSSTLDGHDKTLTSSMGTDSKGVNTSGSSPAA